MKEIIVGREFEKNRLQRLFNSKNAEFIAVYGRRRVGKTYLIRRFFEKCDGIFFQISGIKDGSIHKQLSEFKKALEFVFYVSFGMKIETPLSWLEAFEILTKTINELSHGKKVVLFFDELPWLATKRSGLLEALDYYWNRYWVDMPKLKLIVCGSAASWMLNNLIHAKGGLHNRITAQMPLEPFTLQETKSYLKHCGVNLDFKQIVELYMAFGGVPQYLKYIEPGLSAAQNISHLCFHPKAPMVLEFQDLFSSLFDHAEAHHELISILSEHREGISRSNLLGQAKYSQDGGSFSARIDELEQAGFVKSFIPWHKERGMYYKIIDEYTLFYLTWIAPLKGKTVKEDYWQVKSGSAAYRSWAGYAFELICHKHLSSIMKKLNIPFDSVVSTWRYKGKIKEDECGAQIDLLFDRSDDAITICEIKYTNQPFVLDKKAAQELLDKTAVYKKQTKTKKQIFISIISANGLKPTLYSEELVAGVVTLKDLFTV